MYILVDETNVSDSNDVLAVTLVYVYIRIADSHPKVIERRLFHYFLSERSRFWLQKSSINQRREI